MSFEVFDGLNWLAVIAATIAFWALGALWYARPVFGRAWQKASGTVLPEGYRPGPALYIGTLVSNLIAVLATAMLAAATGSTTVSHAIVLGLVVGVGYALSMLLLGATTETKPDPRTWFAINGSYHLVGLVGAALIVTLWD